MPWPQHVIEFCYNGLGQPSGTSDLPSSSDQSQGQSINTYHLFFQKILYKAYSQMAHASKSGTVYITAG